MNGSLREQNELRIAEEAAEWLGVLERADKQDCEAFAKWVTESRRHVEEFLFASAVDRVLDRVDAQRRMDVEEILQRADANVVPLDHAPALSPKRARHSQRSRWILRSAIAASVVAIAIAALLFLHPPGSQDYRTAVGQQRTVELPDGSSVHLNTRSRARVRYSADARDVELIAGEALFDVKRDTGRPFRVHSGDTLIQALGTQFNVYRRAHATTVAVVEGAVRISTQHQSSELVAAPEKSIGQEARISENGRITRQRPVEAARVDAWRQRRLMFRADRLEDIAAEFNRYNETPQIRIEGKNVRDRRFTGVFNADDPRALAQFLGSYGDLTSEQQDGVLVIREK